MITVIKHYSDTKGPIDIDLNGDKRFVSFLSDESTWITNIPNINADNALSFNESHNFGSTLYPIYYTYNPIEINNIPIVWGSTSSHKPAISQLSFIGQQSTSSRFTSPAIEHLRVTNMGNTVVWYVVLLNLRLYIEEEDIVYNTPARFEWSATFRSYIVKNGFSYSRRYFTIVKKIVSWDDTGPWGDYTISEPYDTYDPDNTIILNQGGTVTISQS